jgi:LysM repeat protein
MISGSAAQSRVHSIMKTAFSQVGNPYRYGGNSPETGFDCSGFVGWVYKQFGVDLPRSSRDMMAVGTPITREELRPGDLVFFNYGYSHVGIYTGDDKYIHSPSTGKRIQESDLNGRGRGDHYVGARRVIDNKGVSAISDRLKTEWVQASRHATAVAMADSAARRHTGAAAYRGTPRRGSRTQMASSRSSRSRAGSRNVAARSAKSHKVVSGDTLVDIARRNGVTATDLAAFNGIANRNRIKPGQAIKIPPKAKASAKAKGSGKAKASAKKGSGKGKAASASAKKGAGKGKAASASAKKDSGKPKATAARRLTGKS